VYENTYYTLEVIGENIQTSKYSKDKYSSTSKD